MFKLKRTTAPFFRRLALMLLVFGLLYSLTYMRSFVKGSVGSSDLSFDSSSPFHRSDDSPSSGMDLARSKQDLQYPYVLVLLRMCPDYVKHHIWQFLQYNDEMHLISDLSCKDVYSEFGSRLYIHDIKLYQASSEEFDKKYFPETLPGGEVWGGRRNFELACFQRWFVLDEFMAQKGLNNVFSADGDSMIYVNVTEHMNRHHAGQDFVLIWHYPGVSNSFISFSKPALTDLLEFWKRFFIDLPVLMPKMPAGDAHILLNDMSLSKVYGVSGLCRGKAAAKDCGLYHDSINENWPQIMTGIWEIIDPNLFALAVRVNYQPKFLPATLGVSRHRPFGFDNNIWDLYETRFENVGQQTNSPKQVVFIRNNPYLLPKDYLHINPSDNRHSVQVEFDYPLFRTLGLHFQGDKKQWMVNYRRSRHGRCGLICVCESLQCSNCKCDSE